MKIPKYIVKHIEANNKLLLQANKHSDIVNNWYEKQLELLGADESDFSCEDFSEIQGNWDNNGYIDASAIEANLELLKDK